MLSSSARRSPLATEDRKGAPRPKDGNQFNLTAKSKMSKTPSQKTGMETPS